MIRTIDGDPCDACTITVEIEGEAFEISIALDGDLEVATVIAPAEAPPLAILEAWNAWQEEIAT